ncbi:MAG: T9SS type A sorting domain-containing protein [Candidatus Cloacimonetes bacterium]|nr:T9SS type A sorting domain-containing protein [Candidatus Cloacimonadota bacterium]
MDRGAGPLAWRLAPPWPNPSNGQVVLSWRMPVPASVSLELYDIQGRLTTLITNEERAAGSHQLALDTARLPSGVYFLRLTGNGWHETRKLTVVR